MGFVEILDASQKGDVKKLIKLYKQGDSAALDALKKMRTKFAVKSLIDAVKNTSHPDMVRWCAAEALGEIGDAAAVEPLIAVLDDPNDTLQEYAVRALGKIRDKRAVEPLIQCLSRRSNYFRDLVVEVLGEIGDQRAIPPLVKQSNSSLKNLSRALAKLGWEPNEEGDNSIQYWIDVDRPDKCAEYGATRFFNWLDSKKEVLFNDNSFHEKFYQGYCKTIENALIKIGISSIEFLISVIKESDFSWTVMRLQVGNSPVNTVSFKEHWEYFAHRVLAKMNGTAVAPILKLLEQNRNPYGVAMLLKKIGGLQSIEALSKTLGHENWRVRGVAAEGIGVLGDKHHLEKLISMLQDDNSRVRGSAALALGVMGDEKALQALRELQLREFKSACGEENQDFSDIEKRLETEKMSSLIYFNTAASGKRDASMDVCDKADRAMKAIKSRDEWVKLREELQALPLELKED